MTSKFQPFDIQRYCRVYFRFIGTDGKTFNTYYEREQILPDEVISREALINAEDMKSRFGLRELISIFIARTPEQVVEYESQM